MHFFLLLNDLAGRYAFLDECARFYYVGAVPLLAALFLGRLLLLSRAENGDKMRLGLAVLLSLGFLALLGVALESVATAWHLGTLSPRPFMTRRVHLLVVEPQDNSFPCFEVAVAAIFSVAMAFSHRKWGFAGGVLTLLLALTRLFCGTNFFADVAIGAILGAGIGAAFGALCTAPHPFEREAVRAWLPASAAVVFSLGASYVAFAQTPRFAAKLPLFWSSTATAASQAMSQTASQAPGSSSAPGRKATRAARAGISEGEGLAEAPATMAATGAANGGVASGEMVEPSAEELALSKRSHLFLPAVEKFLRGKLAPRALPFRLLDVEVAPVKAGNSSYRCAAIRFEISQSVPELRRQTAEVAAALVKLAFQNDSNLQNVDVTAILRGDGAQIDGTSLRFAGDEVPVFTASIERQKLRLPAPRWANDPRLDGGLWLRTRSRLYINEKILPAIAPVSKPPVSKPPVSKPVPAPSPVALPRISPNGVAPIPTGPLATQSKPRLPRPNAPPSRPAPPLAAAMAPKAPLKASVKPPAKSTRSTAAASRPRAVAPGKVLSR